MQPTIRSLNNISLININLLKLFDYNQHLLEFINMPSKEKTLLNFHLGSQNVKILSKENNSWKQGLMFFPPFNLGTICINLVPPKHLQFPIH